MNSQAIALVGPTASGKTSIGYRLAQDFQIQDIVSCDSRQIYKYLDIVTGKDIPSNFFFTQVAKFQTYSIGYYQGQINNHQLRLWGFDIAQPNQSFSVTEYSFIFNQYILPLLNTPFLLIGGTGYYINGLISPQPTFNIPPDSELRRYLSHLSTFQLQHLLNSLDKTRFDRMNNSDRNNPRRLIRAIEVSQYNKSNRHMQLTPKNQTLKILWIGIKHASLESMDQSIRTRVIERFNHTDIQNEIGNIINNKWQEDIPNQTLGYPQLIAYFSTQIPKQEAIEDWITKEKQYARRQLTWFRKQSQINWFVTGNYIKIKEFVSQML